MGDISEMRGVIVVACAFFGFAALIALMPTQFYSSSSPVISLPTDLDSFNWLSWNSTAAITILYDADNESEINGYYFHWSSVKDVAQSTPPNPDDMIYVRTESVWWIFHWNYQWFTFYYNGEDVSTTAGYLGIRISTIQDIFDSDAVNGTMEKMHFKMSNAYITVNFNMIWNTTLYATPTLALEASNLTFVMNTQFEEAPSQINAWSLLTGILTFRNFEGIPSVFSNLLGIGLWAALGYLGFIFILRMIGAVFGGGGA